MQYGNQLVPGIYTHIKSNERLVAAELNGSMAETAILIEHRYILL